jgi:hypothetical protein
VDFLQHWVMLSVLALWFRLLSAAACRAGLRSGVCAGEARW